MTDKVLRDLKDTYKRKDILLPAIERHVVRSMSMEEDDRPDDVMHPSDMAKGLWCGRADYYRIMKVEPDYKETPPSFRMENVFDYGHSIHQKYQRWLWEMGILFGVWECLSCRNRWFGPAPTMCDRCGAKPHDIRYREVPFDLPDLLVVGHADGIVLLRIEDINEFVLIEIKSIGINSLRLENPKLYDRYVHEQLTPDELWFFINRPFGSHLRQGLLYGYMTKSVYPNIDIKRIVFIYEWKPTQAVKEFVVPYNEAPIQKVLEQARNVALAVQAEDPPDRPEWAVAIDGKGCKSCGYRNTCWGVARTSSGPTQPAVRVVRSTPAKRRRVLRPST